MDGSLGDTRMAGSMVGSRFDSVVGGNDHQIGCGGLFILVAALERASLMMLVDRYIAVTVVKAALMTLLALTTLAFILELVDELEDVGKGDYSSWHAMLVAACSTPRFIYESFPVSALIGALLGLGGMSASGELVAMRAAGMSPRKILFAVIKSGVLLMLLVVTVGDGIGPLTEQYGNQLKLEKQNKQITFSSRNGFWAKDGNTFVNIRRVSVDQELREVIIYEFSSGRQLQAITQAATGQYQDDRWILTDVQQSQIEQKQIAIRQLPTLAWDSMVDPSVLSVALIDPLMLPVWELWAQIQNLKSRGQSAASYEVTFWGKIATPLTTIAMLILAVPMVMSSSRTTTAGQRVFSGAMLGTLLYLFSRGFSFLVLALELPTVAVLLFPLIIILLLILWLNRVSAR
ncbi:MAG TPA: LPS export ABC transporter permease LptG [Thiolapillus brandeum]|uniref:LPS export ABC transporter permease LptG n=1 Tax=Thiolapillus brandeum TaxID=1076588 RepID=A0A831K4C5_9GAMM|nr:LPS export ABC transporter permease LptG [Thiolapillus brandeum]